MKIELLLGEGVLVAFKDSDGGIAVVFGHDAILVKTDMPDSSGRVGEIYREDYGVPPQADGEAEDPESITHRPDDTHVIRRFVDWLAEDRISTPLWDLPSSKTDQLIEAFLAQDQESGVAILPVGEEFTEDTPIDRKTTVRCPNCNIGVWDKLPPRHCRCVLCGHEWFQGDDEEPESFVEKGQRLAGQGSPRDEGDKPEQIPMSALMESMADPGQLPVKLDVPEGFKPFVEKHPEIVKMEQEEIADAKRQMAEDPKSITHRLGDTVSDPEPEDQDPLERLRHVQNLAAQVNLTVVKAKDKDEVGLKHPDHEAVFEFDTFGAAEAFLVGYSANECWGTGGPTKLKPEGSDASP